MTPLRILMICPQFRPIVGGYERAAEGLSRALVGRRHAVTVVAERRQHDWPKRETFDGVELRRWWCIYRPGLHTMTSLLGLAIWLLVHGRAFQVWHVHQYGVHATLAVLLGELSGRRVVLKLTSSGPQGLSAALGSLPMAAVHRWAHRRVAACIAVSEETTREALDFGIPTARVQEISNGVDVDALQPPTSQGRESARRSVRMGDGFIVLAVGRLAIEKNPLGLVEAWKKARPALPGDAKLVCVGDGPQRQDVQERIAKLRLTDSVVLAGHAGDVYPWYAAADVFVLSSHNEGMANTLLEAMACALPCVATAVSGTSQLLVKTRAGLVVPTGDMNALAGALVQVASDADARQTMGVRARAAVVGSYSLDVTGAQVEALYFGLLRAR